MLEEEVGAVDAVANLLPEQTRRSCKVTPWDSSAHEIISLHELDRLDSQGGTDPNALLCREPHLGIIQAADVWFLLTDGEIDDSLVQIFSGKLAHQ